MGARAPESILQGGECLRSPGIASPPWSIVALFKFFRLKHNFESMAVPARIRVGTCLSYHDQGWRLEFSGEF